VKTAAVLLLVLLSFLSLGVTASAQAETAYIRVVDQQGNAQVATTVILSTGTVRKSFLTNSTGWAEFVGLSAGTYNVSVLYSDLVIATDTITIPGEKVKNVTVFLKDLSILLLDLDGHPVFGRKVVLKSERGNFTLTRETDNNGGAVFQSIPYSSIETIGPYNLKVEHSGIKVVEASISVPVSNVTLTAKLLGLRITVTDLEGNPVTDALVFVKSTKTASLSLTRSTSAGSAVFEEVPASSLAEVGDYQVWATVGQVVVFNQTRGFDESLNYSATASLGRLTVKVVDESGDPISNVAVSVANQVNRRFGFNTTDSSGVVVLREMPLSTTSAGQYSLVFTRGGVKVKESNISLTVSQPSPEETVRIGRIKALVAVKDFRGNPVADAAIELTDLSTPGKKLTASTTSEGVAEVVTLPGAYRVTVRYRGHEVLSRVVAMNQTELEIAGVGVDLPVTVIVVDSNGKAVVGALANATFGGEVLFEGEVGRDGSFNATVPYAGSLVVSVELGGVLQAIETIEVDQPTTEYIYLQSIIGLAGMQLTLGTLMEVLTVLLIVGVAGLIVVVWRDLITKRLKRIRRPLHAASREGKPD